MSDPIGQSVCERLGRAKTSRMNWEAYWQETAQYCQPEMSNTFFEGGYALTQGTKKDQKRYDGTAEIALDRFSAAMESMLTPRNSRYQAVTTNDRSLNKIPRVMNWFDEATDALFKYRYDSKANFASQCHEHYRSLGLLGTAAMFIDRLQPMGLRYAEIHIAQLYFYENHQGIIDECIRRFRLTAVNVVKKFGKDTPEDIVKQAATSPQDVIEIIHCVMPNEEYDPARRDYRGMKFASYYVYEKTQTTIRKEGYHTFPYAISRYTTAAGEIYGRGPAMKALTNIKLLNQQKKTIIKQGHRVVDPVLLAHDDGVIDSFSLKPGSINPGAMSADGKRLVDILPTGNLAIGEKMMEIERGEINAAFLVDLFQILVDGPQKTATEVIELAREKGVLLSPTMGRQESEFLGPLTEREMDLLGQQRLIPPMPPELIEAQGHYDIIYDSPLSRAQKAEQASGLMQTVQWAAEVAQLTQNPAPLDHFDFDVIIPELSRIRAVPGRWMMTPDKLAALRDQRSQQTATQQVIEAGPSVAAMLKNK